MSESVDAWDEKTARLQERARREENAKRVPPSRTRDGSFWRYGPLSPHKVLRKFEPGSEFFLGRENVAHERVTFGSGEQVDDGLA